MSDSPGDLREQLRQYAEGQTLLLELTRRITDGRPLSAVLPEVAEVAMRGSHADGLILLLGEATAPQRYAAGSLHEAMVKYDGLIWRHVAEKGVLEAADLAKARGDLTSLKGALGSCLAFSLTAYHSLHGVLWAAYKKPRAFTEIDRSFLSLVAGQTAVVVGNAHAFEAARRSSEQLGAILDSSADPILVVNDQETVVLLNPAAESTLGVKAEAVIGKLVGDVIDAASLVGLLRGGNEQTGAEAVEWQSAKGKTFASRVSDICDDSGRRTGRVLILRDITSYKTLRENQSEFVSTVSHDLRSPLTYMHGYATMMPMVGEMNERQKGFAEKIVAGIAQMTDLVDKILDASRLDPEGNYTLDRNACDVAKVVSEVVSNHAQSAERKRLTLITEIDPAVPILNLDDVMLRRAMNNLVDNAVKYTPEDGRILVRARVENNNLLLSVQDTGLGISEADQAYLFERFHRVRRREHQTVKGSGLGLFIVKSVAQRHGGDAWVTSKEEQGSTFFIRIPLEPPNLLGADSKKA